MDLREIQHFNYLANFTVEQATIVSAGGSILSHLCTDIQLQHPHYSESQSYYSRWHSEAAMPVTLGAIAEVSGHSRLDRLLSLLYQNEALTKVQNAPLFALCPAIVEQPVRDYLSKRLTEVTVCTNPQQFFTKLNLWIEASKTQSEFYIYTLDSLIEPDIFALQHSDLFHEQNPDGLIASEGSTLLHCRVTVETPNCVSALHEPFYKQANTEPTQAIATLIKESAIQYPQLYSNHGLGTAPQYEVYRALQAIPLDSALTLFPIRQSLGSSGLNELGLMLALATEHHAIEPLKNIGLCWFYNDMRVLWPIIGNASTDQTNSIYQGVDNEQCTN